MSRWLVVHPSDEMYGSDRVLLEIVDALGTANVEQCWLPTDVPYPARSLTRALNARAVPVQHWNFPVLRRAYANPTGLAALTLRALRAVRPARSMVRTTDGIYLNTSAVLPMAPILRRSGLRVVCHVHESWGPTERWLLGPLLRFCDLTIAVSAAVAAALPARTTVIHNGFPDLPAPHVPPHGTGQLRVLLASRWSTWKGHREFLTAWRHADLPDARLTVIGGPPPAGEGVDVHQLVRDLEVDASVTVLPERSDITDLIEAAHVIVVPSTRPDPLPTIAIEAARAGRACIASDSGGLPEIVEDGVTGWLVPPGDVVAWAAVLRSLSIGAARERGMGARRKFESQFSTTHFQAKLRMAIGSAGGRG